MEKLGLNLDDGSSSADQKQANPQKARKLSIQRCIQSLVQICQCNGEPSCQKMKSAPVQHTKICTRKRMALCCNHAKYCQEPICPVPYCKIIKYKIKQQLLMNIRGSAVMGSSAVSSGAPQAVVLPALPSASGPPNQPGIGLKPSTRTPPVNVLQVVKQMMQGGQPGPQEPIFGAMSQAQPDPNPAIHKQALQQLLQTLRPPDTPEEQEQILLMAALIKQRQTGIVLEE